VPDLREVVRCNRMRCIAWSVFELLPTKDQALPIGDDACTTTTATGMQVRGSRGKGGEEARRDVVCVPESLQMLSLSASMGVDSEQPTVKNVWSNILINTLISYCKQFAAHSTINELRSGRERSHTKPVNSTHMFEHQTKQVFVPKPADGSGVVRCDVCVAGI
jgi:hypothetical protein